MYKKIIQIASFACALVLSPVVLADSWGCGERLHKMVESLKLDESQKEKIKPILEQFKTTMKNDAGQMKDISKQLEQQTQSAKMDQSTVDGLIDKKVKLIADMMKAKITAKNQIYAVLNAEQKAQIQNKMKKAEAKIAEHFKSCHDDD